MNFYTQEEKDILSTYPINDRVLISDYLADFVLKNPLNFPFSTGIMKEYHLGGYNSSPKDMYTRDNIFACLSKIKKNYKQNTIYIDCITHDCLSFTALVLNLYYGYPNSSLIVHQTGDKFFVSINDGVHKYSALISPDGGAFICYNNSDCVILFQMFGTHRDNLPDISKNFKSNHYYMEFMGDENELLPVVTTIACITTCRPPSWSGHAYLEASKYQCVKSIESGYNILRLCDSGFESINECLVKNATKTEAQHVETVSDFSNMDKKIVS